MSIHFARQKTRHWLLSLAYKINKLIPLNRRKKLDLYLDLAWITDRLAIETAAGVFRADDHPLRLQKRAFLLKHISPTHRILDLGCKEGDISAIIAASGAHVVGVDLDVPSIEAAKRLWQLPNLEFHAADAFEVIRSGKRFDAVILSHILEHIDEPADFLKKCAKLADMIYIEVPDFDAPYLNPIRVARDRKLVYSDADHLVEYDRRDMAKLLTECGLKPVDTEYMAGVMKFWCQPV